MPAIDGPQTPESGISPMRMKRRLKWITRLLTALAVLAALGGGFYYFQVHRPIKEFRKLGRSGEPIDAGKIRDAAHKAIRWVPDHDALVALCDVADESSVPVLIRALRKVPSPDSNGTMICTTDHCFQALRKASGRYFENNIETWENWYRDYRAHGSPRLTMKEEVAALVTEAYVKKYVRPHSDPVALAAHHATDLDQSLLDAHQITAIEVNPRNGKSKTIFENESRRPPNEGMVTGVPNAHNIGFFYPASPDQPTVELRVNHDCDAFGHIAIHLVVPNPLVIAKQKANANKAANSTSSHDPLPAGQKPRNEQQ